MQRLEGKRLRQKEAARILGLSTRQVKRLWRAYQKDGAKGLVSKRRGKASNNRLDAGFAASIGFDPREICRFLADVSARETERNISAQALARERKPDHDRRRAIDPS